MTEVFSLTELAEAARSGDRGILDRLDTVCSQAGYFGLTGLGLPAGLVEQVHARTIEFFALPTAAKAALQSSDGDQFTGWKGQADNRNEFGLADLKEMFHIGPRADPALCSHDQVGAVPPTAPGAGAGSPLWPAQLPGFAASWHQYYREMQRVAAELGVALAAAIGISAAQWLEMTAGNWADLAANYYPAATGSAPATRNAVHSDLTLFTILYQDSGGGGGLHMQERDGRWQDVPPADGVFAVNVGELFTYLTSGRWWAVPHEVAAADPSAPGADTARISIPFFYRPADTRTISPLLVADDAERPAPLAVGRWVAERKRLTRTA